MIFGAQQVYKEMREVQTVEEFKNAISSNKKVLVDFFATWCGPCKVISPFLESLSSQHPEILFIKVDVDLNEEASTQAEVEAMPTFVAYLNGQEFVRFEGANQAKLTSLVTKLENA